MVGLELAQLELSVDAIYVDSEQASRDCAGGDANVVIWIAAPPPLHDCGVLAGVKEPALRCRQLGALPAGENRHIAGYECRGGTKHVHSQNGTSSPNSSAGGASGRFLGCLIGNGR